MLRRTCRAALILPLLSGLLVPSAGADYDGGRVVVLTVDGTDIRDWVAANAFESFGGFGLLSTRTGADANDPARLRASAYATVGAGTAADVGPGARAGRHDGATLGLLADVLARDRGAATAIGDASGTDIRDAPASLAVMRLDGTAAISPLERLGGSDAAAVVWRPDRRSPAGRRTDPASVRAAVRERLAWAALLVVDTGDTARADRTYANDAATRAGWIRRALVDASALADDIRTVLGPRDTLIVASLVPPLERVRRGVHLGAIAFTDGSSLPTSGTTRRDGVVALSDLAPTALERIGVIAPSEMSGRPIRFVPAASSRTFSLRADADFDRALGSRRPLTRLWLASAALLNVCAFIAIAAGRGRAAAAGRIPRSGRDVLGIGLLAAAGAPAAFLIAPLLPGDSVAAAGWWTLALAAGTALAARVALGHGRALVVIASAGAALYAVDLVVGSPLAARSALGFQIAGGGRFYGVDEGMLGVLLAAPLIGSGMWLDRAHDARRRLGVAAVVLAAVAILAAAPAFGSKFGAPFTLVPAFGVFVVLASGRRIERKSVIGIAIATVILSASLAAVDALSTPETASHIGRELAGGTATGALIARKLSSLVEVTATTVWLPVAAVIAGSAILLLVRRRDLVARGTWGKPATRAALWGGVTGCVFALVSNDTGIITVAAAAPILGAGFYLSLLSPNQAP